MDPVNFSGIEILKMAERIEENGEKFYTEAAKAAKTKKIKDLFEFLAKEEVKHREYFHLLVKNEPAGSVFDPYIEEAALYIKALSDNEVFKTNVSAKDLAKKVADEGAALNHAINAEKESLLFYYELQKAVREKDKKIMDMIIHEEKEHLKKLTEMKAGL